MNKYIIPALLIVLTAIGTIATQSLLGSVSTVSSVDKVLKQYEVPLNYQDEENLINAMTVSMIEYSTEDVTAMDVKFVTSNFEHCSKLMNYVGDNLTSKEKVNKQLLTSYISYRNLNCNN